MSPRPSTMAAQGTAKRARSRPSSTMSIARGHRGSACCSRGRRSRISSGRCLRPSSRRSSGTSRTFSTRRRCATRRAQWRWRCFKVVAACLVGVQGARAQHLRREREPGEAREMAPSLSPPRTRSDGRSWSSASSTGGSLASSAASTMTAAATSQSLPPKRPPSPSWTSWWVAA